MPQSLISPPLGWPSPGRLCALIACGVELGLLLALSLGACAALGLSGASAVGSASAMAIAIALAWRALAQWGWLRLMLRHERRTAPRGGWALACARAALTLLWAQWVALPFFRSPARAPCNGPARGVVILVPGFLCHGGVMRAWSRALAQVGFSTLSFEGLAPWEELEPGLARLAQLVAHARQAAPGEPILLMGHSMGGLLCREQALRCAQAHPPEPIAAVIAVGSPLAGTACADRSFFPMAKLMRLGSPWCASHPEREAALGLAAPFCAFSGSDLIVIPHESANGAGAGSERALSLAGRGHLELLLSASASREIAAWVSAQRAELPGAPTP